MIRRMVLLPPPDGPSSATSFPVSTWKLTSSIALKAPNCLQRCSTWMPMRSALDLRAQRAVLEPAQAQQQQRAEDGQQQRQPVGGGLAPLFERRVDQRRRRL